MFSRQIGSVATLSALALASLTGCGTQSTASTKAAAAKPLSAVFTGQCASCHGAEGKGDFGPNLTQLDYATFKSTVRSGKNAMPAFDAGSYSDADLNSDYTALTGKPAQ